MCKLCANVGNVDFLYQKDDKLKPGDAQILQEWMAKEQHLPKISDYQMLLFLSSCYYNIQATKTCLENFYTLKTHCPEFFSGRNLNQESVKTHLNTVIAAPFQQLIPTNNYMVCIVKLHNCKTDTFVFNDTIKVIDMALTIYNQQLGPQEAHVLIMDGAGLQLGHVLKMNIMSLKKYFIFVQEAMPVRLKQIHVVNVNGIVEKFVNLVRQCLKRELQEQMYCHSKMESLYKFVPKEVLPKDYGGNELSLEELHKNQVENIKEHIDLLIADEDVKSNEQKRVGKAKNLEQFGIQGTFKKLDID
ncbi:alpha-tocopherol transfer protein-like [Onthophagus taurus]|uniref:alpha-tocopherol transfer protein-like n=1 Tax=Onthophagus taurus TaxID=166361 RepID=UPI0039BE49E1